MDSIRSSARPATWKVLLAFAIIYFVWGSTFLAIRVGVREVPPFLLAGMRFFVAGIILYGWMRVRGTPSPSVREWTSASFLALLIFVFDYGLLFWAERRVPSGIAAVMMATMPVFMVGRSMGIGGTPVDRAGACALVVAAISWSVAASLSRKVPLPAAKVMSSGAQMLAGGVLLTVAAALLGEFRGFHLQAVSRGAWLALAYLIVAGSIAGFTAYVWLIHHESPTKVGTYAYVNPVVAVLVGYFFGGEAIGPRTVVGTLLVLVSVLVITIAPAKKAQNDAVVHAGTLSVDAE